MKIVPLPEQSCQDLHLLVFKLRYDPVFGDFGVLAMANKKRYTLINAATQAACSRWIFEKSI
jgi:hypothetical protein